MAHRVSFKEFFSKSIRMMMIKWFSSCMYGYKFIGIKISVLFLLLLGFLSLNVHIFFSILSLVIDSLN